MESSPRDLSVLFRSLARRQEDALGGVSPAHEHVHTVVADLALHVSAAARVVGSHPDAAAVADVLASRPASSWNDAELGHLREIGLEVGRLLRALAERAQEAQTQGDEH